MPLLAPRLSLPMTENKSCLLCVCVCVVMCVLSSLSLSALPTSLSLSVCLSLRTPSRVFTAAGMKPLL